MRRMISLFLMLALCLCACTGPAETPGPTNAFNTTDAPGPTDTSELVSTPEPVQTAELSSESQTGGIADQAARAVLDSQGYDDLSPMSGEDLDFYLTQIYGLAEGTWTDAAVYAASGVDAREIVVISGAAVTAEALEAYRQSRLGDFFGYAPEQADLLDRAGLVLTGSWVALLVCDDPAAAEEALMSCLQGEAAVPESPAPTAADTPEPAPTPEPEPEQTPVSTPEPAPTLEPTSVPMPTPTLDPRYVRDERGYFPFLPPNEFDMSLYDTSAILAAYTSGNTGGLSDKDAAILARCREVLAECVTPDMTDFEKELALHDWLVEWGEYDLSVHDAATPMGRADNTNPYGMLVGGYGICLGYAATFQLLMDLSGVECITVVGASSWSEEDHAWNMVKLEGEWYCVDPTWDDPILTNPAAFTQGELVRRHHGYFNVTSDWMRSTNHQWDYLNVPEANATRFFWDGTGELPA